MKLFSKILLLISFAIIVEVTTARYRVVKVDQEQELASVGGGMIQLKSKQIRSNILYISTNSNLNAVSISLTFRLALVSKS